jgi:hypothetical protein
LLQVLALALLQMLKHPNKSIVHLLKLSCQAKALLRSVPLVCAYSYKLVYILPNKYCLLIL